MEYPNNIKKEAPGNFTELEYYLPHEKEKVIGLLRGLPREEMITRIKQLELSETSLDYLCFHIALESEDYEICAAVINIKNGFSSN
jgi:hypothetical protein